MPVRQRQNRSSRSLIIGVVGLMAGIIAVLALFVLAIPSLTEDGRIEARLGDPVFQVGSAERNAALIADGGPLLLPDVAGGRRDIYVQHLGDDPATGWYAFDARLPGRPATCTLVWESDDEVFVDPCDDSEIPADGEGLRRYVVEVDEGTVVVDLFADPPG